MKPKDLKRVYPFEERRPCLEDRIFYVPHYYDAHERSLFPPFADLFGNDKPICVEYCSGNGDWIIEKAKSQDSKNWIAVEKRFDRVRKIWSKLKNNQLSNLVVISGEAFTFTHHYVPNGSIEEVYINFPDPWPKTKHAKHRLLHTTFLSELSRVLKPNKTVTLVSDDLKYVTHTLSLSRVSTEFIPSFPPPHYLVDYPDYGHSWFENLWREQGKAIHYLQLQKR